MIKVYRKGFQASLCCSFIHSVHAVCSPRKKVYGVGGYCSLS